MYRILYVSPRVYDYDVRSSMLEASRGGKTVLLSRIVQSDGETAKGGKKKSVMREGGSLAINSKGFTNPMTVNYYYKICAPYEQIKFTFFFCFTSALWATNTSSII